ncbi:GNAT family N-acetyltransferase [Pseudomonas syringae pv. aptata]|uniref:GNAT family N-acetyltransferase n=1 Tax=Pseudomonas syringae TaxID=317 RepID=UPI0013C2B7FB|nr:GNAT family N-acetyltransferase [Pseudomonas syringae]
MPTYSLHTTQPSEAVKHQVATMTGAYTADLHRYDFAGMVPVNLLLGLYQNLLAWEVMSYLDRIGLRPEAPTELITAHGGDHSVIGYVLYLPVPSHPDACGLTYMVVHHQHRGLGIGRTMMEKVIARYPHVELTCTPAKVALYQAMGFQIVDSDNTQIVMNTRNHSCEGFVALQDVSTLYESKQAQELQMKLVDMHGKGAVFKDRKRLKKHIAEATKKAKAFYQANRKNR